MLLPWQEADGGNAGASQGGSKPHGVLPSLRNVWVTAMAKAAALQLLAGRRH